MRLLATLLALFIPLAEAQSLRPSAETVRTWQERKFGMFIHFGIYSELGGMWKGERITRGYSEQIQAQGNLPKDEYEQVARRFNPVRWDPDQIAQLARAAGMKFIVITSKHHDGFSMFHTRQSEYNVVDSSPYGKDIVKGLADACARVGLKFGVYYSTIDWHYPGGTGADMPRNDNLIPKAHEDFNVAQLQELTAGYGPLTEIWFDMGKPTPEQSKRFTDTVHKAQPQCMVSGRVFNHQGDFTVMGDNSIPEYVIDEPWQTPASIYDETWGYRSWQNRGDAAAKTSEHIEKLVKVVSRGGNYLLNIGPRGDGSVVEFEAEVLKGVGAWLKDYGEAIYAASAQPFRKLDFGYATVKPGRLYLFVKTRPAGGRLVLPGLKTKLTRAYVLGGAKREVLKVEGNGVVLGAAQNAQPFEVVVAEYGGALEVIPPSIAPHADGSVLLSAKQADTFYNYNGHGYYERPSIYKLQWHFTAKPGKYRIEVKPALTGTSIQVDGRSAGLEVQLGSRDYHTLAITPPPPFAKGDRLPGAVDLITLTREN
ncbi:MAG: alpha-L-fucosidase [Acidobacteria bacterium]|nr:alpha-L-fucosidase [Acidobacteriota bacterium]